MMLVKQTYHLTMVSVPILSSLTVSYRIVSSDHDNDTDGVGITQPVSKGSSDPFPTCLGYPDNTKRHESFHKQLARGIKEDDEISTICCSTNHKGWRVLRFHKRVGYGKQCYKRVQDAVLDWDFDAQEGKKSMGIKSVSAKQNKSMLLKLEERNILSSKGTSFTKPRRSLLASFTEICLPKPFQAMFVVSPVHVSYEVKDARTNLKDLFSSTAYCTLSGHLLSGEERVTVIWRKGAGDEVDVEIVSFSRSAPSMFGKIVWPLMGRMQKQFFLSEMAHLDEVGKRKA